MKRTTSLLQHNMNHILSHDNGATAFLLLDETTASRVGSVGVSGSDGGRQKRFWSQLSSLRTARDRHWYANDELPIGPTPCVTLATVPVVLGMTLNCIHRVIFYRIQALMTFSCFVQITELATGYQSKYEGSSNHYAARHCSIKATSEFNKYNTTIHTIYIVFKKKLSQYILCHSLATCWPKFIKFGVIFS